MNCLRYWNNVNNIYTEHHKFWFITIFCLFIYVTVLRKSCMFL